MLFVITGGGGYAGYHIGYKLSESGHDVRLIDIRPPDPLWEITAPEALYDAIPQGFWDKFGAPEVRRKGKLTFLYTDITDKAALRTSFAGADGVIHTASYGVSGEEQMPPYYGKQEMINLMGTKNALEAAHLEQVKAFVFTSTYNVVYGGEPILGGDETLPYFPLHRHVDQYSRTKAMAEMLVLSFNGKQADPTRHGSTGTKSDLYLQQATATLRTCALRPNGIMGLGEQRHMSRIMNIIQKGLLLFTYGDKISLVDYVGIQNVVQAHILAVMQLLAEGTDAHSSEEHKTLASGEAFFISDDSPIQSLEYFRPVVEGLGFTFPSWNVPFPLIFAVARIQVLIYRLIYKIYPFVPFLTPAEAFKSGRTNCFKCQKAKVRLGYRPTRPNDLSQVLAFYEKKNMMKKKNNLFDKFFISVISFICLCVLLFIITIVIN